METSIGGTGDVAGTAGLPAGDAPGAQRELLLERVEVHRIRLRAELTGIELVLHVEHRLSGVDERLERAALVVLEALLVHREVEVREEPLRLLDVVLQRR